MTTTPQPAPLPEPSGFKIELPDFTLVVADVSKPMWHGTYGQGILSIYPASLEIATADGLDDSKLPGGDTYVIIHSVPNKEDFFSYASYESSVTHDAIVNHILEMINEHYNTETIPQSPAYIFPPPALSQ